MSTFEDAKAALNRLFNDRSVPQSTTRDQLLDLRDEIDVMMDSLTEPEKEVPEDEP